jgi:hypothetical protein
MVESGYFPPVFEKLGDSLRFFNRLQVYHNVDFRALCEVFVQLSLNLLEGSEPYNMQLTDGTFQREVSHVLSDPIFSMGHHNQNVLGVNRNIYVRLAYWIHEVF